jgi:hypothetical protein
LIHFDAASPRGIVWLASYPKSGNTWVRAFLHTLLLNLQGTKADQLDLDAIVSFGESDRLVSSYRPYLPSVSAIADRAAVAAARPKVQADMRSPRRGR